MAKQLKHGEDARVALDIAQCYDEVTGFDKGDMPNTLPMGCVIARTEFIENNEAALKTFIEENKLSVKAVNEDPAVAAKKIVAKGIIESEAVAAKAIPDCNIVFIDGAEMKKVANANFEVYFSADPTSIGGAVPADDIYYAAQ